MMKQAILTSLMALAMTLGTQAQSYELVFCDDFNGTELDSRVWNIEVNGNGGGNAELQYYRSENVTVADGCLRLTARKEDYLGKHFTSGRINTLGKAAFKHGKVEASICIPQTANGLWPAFWMMGNDMATGTGWPYCGEIDIMEMGNSYGIQHGTQDRFFNGACHWGPYTNGNHPNYARSTTCDYSLQDGGFHLFTLIWDEQKVAMYLDLDRYPDVEPYYVMNIDDMSQDNSPGRYFHKQAFILFNLAVGGHFTGIYNTSGITALANEERALMVDFVRVYQAVDQHDFTMPEGFTPCDVTADGHVDVADINAAINVMLGKGAAGAADINGDYNVDVADINALVNCMLGK
ncbi:MAG: family 16 glycosylhydrolase [Muribaculaceae bacterium]|nr:family 16 glycosylhydrolase [Muribaculaceae bacterium]